MKNPAERDRIERVANPARTSRILRPSVEKVHPSWEEASVRDRVVVRLMQQGVIDETHVRIAWSEWSDLRDRNIRVPLWRLLAVSESLKSEEVYAAAADVYAFQKAEVSEPEALAFLADHRDEFDSDTWDQMIEHFVLPIDLMVDVNTGEQRWTLVTHDPTRPEVHQLIQSLRLRRFELKYTSERFLGRLITETFLGQNQFLKKLEDAPPVLDFGIDVDGNPQEVDEEALEAEIGRSRLINLFEAALVEAVNLGASDVHIFPNSSGHIEIQLRIDGELQAWHVEEGIRPESFIAVVKDNSVNVDRFVRDTAQDGYIQRKMDDVLIRFRVSVLPIASAKQEIHAESIVIRVLDDRKVLTNLGDLGLLGVALERFDKAIRQPHGMVILTGPTGSGKSTTLVAALHQVVTPKVNVITVEDPVEYLMKGIRQIKLGVRLDLEGALRSILRHDPDVVMVGEMRDRATAELAIKLANTGHLTFSTLHTNDAPSAVARLFKMGVEPFLIAYAINLVVGQRLIRKLCSECKIIDQTTGLSDLVQLGFSEFELSTGGFYTHGNNPGCPKCKGAGYKGRRAVAETMLFTPAIRSIIMSAETMIEEEALRETAIEEGMMTLRESAQKIVIEGDTSVEEAIRVTGSET